MVISPVVSTSVSVNGERALTNINLPLSNYHEQTDPN